MTNSLPDSTSRTAKRTLIWTTSTSGPICSPPVLQYSGSKSTGIATSSFDRGSASMTHANGVSRLGNAVASRRRAHGQATGPRSWVGTGRDQAVVSGLRRPNDPTQESQLLHPEPQEQSHRAPISIASRASQFIDPFRSTFIQSIWRLREIGVIGKPSHFQGTMVILML
jgi:hypothetical protein